MFNRRPAHHYPPHPRANGALLNIHEHDLLSPLIGGDVARDRATNRFLKYSSPVVPAVINLQRLSPFSAE